MMAIEEIRAQFPALGRTVYGKPLVYLDNAATSMRPRLVMERQEELASLHNANIHRAVHALAGEATDAYESARDAVARHMHAASRREIIFTSGTTASINLVAFSVGETFIKPGDEILVSEAEHHSNIVPWQMMCQRKGAVLKVLPVDDEGHLRTDLLPNLLTEKTKLVALSQISNVLGILNPVKDVVTICHSNGSMVLVDGAQGMVHGGVDVQDLDCDFYAFSGHKVYAATGTGVLYGKEALLEKMVPYMGGGEMIGTVRFTGTTYAPLPAKFEAGTQNFNAQPTLQMALDFAAGLQNGAYCKRVRDFVLEALTADPRIKLYGVPRGTEDKIALFSFTAEGAHHEDIALILDKMGVAVRSGQMCAEPLMDRFGVTGMVRASFAPYNTLEEAEIFLKALDKALMLLR